MHDPRPLSADVHCQGSTELEEVAGREHSTGQCMTWAESLARVWREKASEQIEASESVPRAPAQIQMSRLRTAVGHLPPVVYYFQLERDDCETGLKVRHRRIVEPHYLKRCYRQTSCHCRSDKGGGDTARAERNLRALTHCSSLPMYALSLNHRHSLLR